MQGRLRACLLLAYRTPVGSIRLLLPRPLEPVTHGPWAFWNIVVCRVDRMRPAGFPAWCGLTYWHVAYRLYARATAADGSEVQGLYFVRSDADSGLIATTGGWMTDFRFHHAGVIARERGSDLSVRLVSKDAAGDAVVEAAARGSATLAAGSPFASVDEAASVLKYQPLGLSVDPRRSELKLAEVEREESAWRERPASIDQATFGFFRTMGQHDVTLERATLVEPIDYRWRLGRRIPLKPIDRADIVPKAVPNGAVTGTA